MITLARTHEDGRRHKKRFAHTPALPFCLGCQKSNSLLRKNTKRDNWKSWIRIQKKKIKRGLEVKIKEISLGIKTGKVMQSFKLATPYCDVEVVLRDEDAGMIKEVEEWICKGCGVPSRGEVEAVMEKFYKMREGIRRMMYDYTDGKC